MTINRSCSLPFLPGDPGIPSLVPGPGGPGGPLDPGDPGMPGSPGVPFIPAGPGKPGSPLSPLRPGKPGGGRMIDDKAETVSDTQFGKQADDNVNKHFSLQCFIAVLRLQLHLDWHDPDRFCTQGFKSSNITKIKDDFYCINDHSRLITKCKCNFRRN